MGALSTLPARLVLVCSLVTAAAHADEGRHRWTFGLDVGSTAPTTPADAWTNGGLGKLRYDDSTGGLRLNRAFVELESRLTPAWNARAVAAYDDDARGVDVTEAFLEWHPIPRSRNRHELRIGAFYPPLSLENTEPGWSSPFTGTFSAVNSWIAEELRTLGAEWSLQRPVRHAGSPHTIELRAAVFAGNDPAGTLLAWKGWSMHDRQTRLGDELALARLPQIQPGTMFEKQAPVGEPFVETDDEAGYYVGAEWRLRRRALVALTHYDNRADPTSLREGQYGWRTVFDHLGVQVELPARVGLIVQWLFGTTAMGPAVGGAHLVDVAAESRFAMLTKDLNRHRVSVRYDEFETEDRDTTPSDSNAETGDAWTVAYRYAASRRLAVTAEWLTVDSTRPARAYFGAAERVTERMLSLRVRLGLGPQARAR